MVETRVRSKRPAPRHLRARPVIYYGYWIVGISFVAQLISVGAQNYVISPFMTPMIEDLAMNRTEFTLARSIGQFMMAFVGVFIGATVDRRGGRMLMRIGAIVLLVAMVALGSVQNLWQWLLLNGVILTAGAAMIGNLVVNVTISKWFVERRGRMVGIAAMGVSFSGVVVTPFAAYLVESIGWRDSWRVLGVCAAAIVLPLSFFMRRAPEDHGLHPDGRTPEQIAQGAGEAAARDFASSITRKQALRMPTFYFVAISFGLGLISIGVMLIHTFPFVELAGYSPQTASLLVIAASVPAGVLKPVWGFFIDTTPNIKLLCLAGFIVNAAAMLTITYGANLKNYPMLFIGYILLGLGWSGFIPMQEVVWASFFGRRYLGAVRSAGLPFALAIGASSPLLVAMWADSHNSYHGAFLAVAVASILGGILLQFAKRPERIFAEQAARNDAEPEKSQ